MVFGSLRDLIRSDPEGEAAIVVDGLTETFRLYHQRPAGLKERLVHPFRRSSYTDFNALEDVSFRVDHGESVGIVGHNGSGKTTLLKVLARILPPDRGDVAINGRVASLLELGAGFHGDLTGRENVFLNGAILGLSREQVARQFDAIVDFAGVREFIDQPIRNYSSGMYVRLGFAIAVHVDPDVLLVDEVLSVGDAYFQARSLERMASFQERGKTVMLVSHDLNAIDQLCDRVIVLDHGHLVFDGPTREGVQQYAQLMGTVVPEDDVAPVRLGTGDVRIVDAALADETGVEVERVGPSSHLTLRVRIQARRRVDACSIGANFETGDGTHLYEVHTTWQGLGIGPLEAGDTAAVEIRFTAHLLAGHYRIQPTVTDPSGRVEHDVLPETVDFEVRPAPGGAGLVDLVAATDVVEGPPTRLEGGSRSADVDGSTTTVSSGDPAG